ncbi:NADP-dependent oxidoreductase domain-containing protein 1 [Scyliorhinus torazame]|uniref:NADP-dependent oxidoreductase domain-containing protein 1 n=1 Tax=Scyliorhinus torazame TaxID=75743 RepID=UPI003B5AC08D
MAEEDFLSLTYRLPSLSFEAPLSGEERTFTQNIRMRAWALTVCGCAHAAFYCRLLTAFRCRLLDEAHFPNSWLAKYKILKSNRGALKIGVLGCGNFGKQLVFSLLQLTDLTAACISVSTRRPETLSDLTDLGIQCFYDNRRLAASVDVMFLCCLPSQLFAVSSQIRGSIPKACVVYSLVTAVPAARLKNFLAHGSIVRPHYSFYEQNPWSKLWETGKSPLKALEVQEVIEVTSPFKEAGLSCVGLKWFEEVMYSVLNFSYLLKVPHGLSVGRLNDLLFGPSDGVEAIDSPVLFSSESFVNASCIQSLSLSSPFPWFDLSSVSLRNTPLTKFFSLHPRLQCHLSFVYRMSMLKKKVLHDTDGCCGH